MTQVMVLFGKDLNDLAEKMNEFFEGREISFSPIYQEMYETEEGRTYQYYSVVYVKDSPNEKVSKPASQAQLKLLWAKGWNGDSKNLTSKQAHDLLKEILG